MYLSCSNFIAFLVFGATLVLGYPGNSNPTELIPRVLPTPEEVAAAEWGFGAPGGA